MFLALLTIKAPPLGWALQTTHQHLLPRVLQKQFALEEPQMPLQQLPLQTQVIEEYFRCSAWFPEKFEIREDFIKLCELESTKSEEIFEMLLSVLKSVN